MAVVAAPAIARDGAARTRFVGCRNMRDDRHFVSGIGDKGQITFNVALPTRGHGFAVDSPRGLVAVFARRPGDYVWLVDTTSGAVVEKIVAANARHFYGHGVFTPDGHLLCSENAYDQGEGVIGVYSVENNGARLDEFPSHGVGPHQIKLLNDDQTLVVANGGILTHPDFPRVKLNMDAMRPNLAYVDSKNGRVLHLVEPPTQWHQLSMRHFDIAQDNRVAVAMQFEGNPLEQPPLIALQHGIGELELLSAPGRVQRSLKNYCGSVAFDRAGERFAVTSPRGGLVTFWHRSGDYLGLHRQPDACGIAADGHQGSFAVSDGTGKLLRVDPTLAATTTFEHADWRWDNHLIAV